MAALPENIRQEVIAEQLRIQRLQQQRNAPASANISGQQAPSSSTNSEISAEFLAALPPGIQEEIIAQHSSEQRNATTSNPDSPVDPTDFIQTLPLQLRRQVLTDLDDSLLALLPNYLVNEAQMLREEMEARHRHIQERFLTSHATHALSRILRTTCKFRLLLFSLLSNHSIRLTLSLSLSLSLFAQQQFVDSALAVNGTPFRYRMDRSCFRSVQTAEVA